jgi:short-subunit dehydrogenase
MTTTWLKTLPLRDRVVLITGAGSGIGRATALALAARGCRLALVDRNLAGLTETAAEAQATGARVAAYALDVADFVALTALPARVQADLGPVTILMNNAGVALVGAFADLTLEEFRWLFEINFHATVALAKACLPTLLAQPAAQIVNVSSIFGLIAPAHQTAYAASKFAVRGFSEALRHELEGTSVGVTVVHPGGVRTGIALNARVAAKADAAEAARQAAEFTALFRTSPEEAAAQIVRAIERRAPRLLLGSDAVALAALQQLLPVAYWSVLKRLFGRYVKT